jgi:hypothetical protein
MKNPTRKLIQVLAAATLLVTVTMTTAQVNKCTGPDGRVVFSDQPCATGQKAAVIKPQVSSAPAAKQAAGATNTADYKSRPEYPECLRLKNRLADFFGSPQFKKDPNNKGEVTVGEVMGGEKKLAETRKDMALYKEICGVIDKEGVREEEKKQELAEKPQRDAENADRCAMMRQKVADLRSIKPLVASSVGEIITPQDVLSRKAEIAEAERQIPLEVKAIEQKCGKQ